MAFEKFFKPNKSKAKQAEPMRPKRKPGRNIPRTKPTGNVSTGKLKATAKDPDENEAFNLTERNADPYRLNKYVSNAGIASRRKADEIIAAGEVTVNDTVITEPGFKVMPGDTVIYKGRVIKPQEQMIYILMNKPRGVITTLSDEKGRKTIMDILKGKVSVRVFPVGRLDKDTTGLLLITNDGDLTRKLSHPSYEVKKIYHVTLDRNLEEQDYISIKTGIQLEDGFIKVDGISFVKDAKTNEVGITIHSGRNRIIRRIFESLGYRVEKLDRVYYGGLTKKDLPRGMTRFLTKQEIIMLKHFN